MRVIQDNSQHPQLPLSTVSQTLCLWRWRSHCLFSVFAVCSPSPGVFGCTKVRPSLFKLTFTHETPLPVTLPWCTEINLVDSPQEKWRHYRLEQVQSSSPLKGSPGFFGNSWNISDASACSADVWWDRDGSGASHLRPHRHQPGWATAQQCVVSSQLQHHTPGCTHLPGRLRHQDCGKNWFDFFTLISINYA